jgi:hypothetical protein
MKKDELIFEELEVMEEMMSDFETGFWEGVFFMSTVIALT